MKSNLKTVFFIANGFILKIPLLIRNVLYMVNYINYNTDIFFKADSDEIENELF